MSATTSVHGYVIHAHSGKWVYRYLPRSANSKWFEGETTDFPRTGGAHGKVSMDMKGKFAVWAYDLVPKALAVPVGDSGREEALQRVDRGGKYLSVLLRGEIGPGPVIVYRDQFRDSCGGPTDWEITDEGEVRPYWHRPSAGYVIDHEVLGEWAWEYLPACSHLVGSAVAENQAWYGEKAIPQELVSSFWAWHGDWDDAVRNSLVRSFDWATHNERGLQLATQLKQVLGAQYRVIYLRPYEEPDVDGASRAIELGVEGSRMTYIHSPYWRPGPQAQSTDCLS